MTTGGGREGNVTSDLVGANSHLGPTPYSCQYLSRELKRAFRMSMAMCSPMWDSSARYPKVSSPCERDLAFRDTQQGWL